MTDTAVPRHRCQAVSRRKPNSQMHAVQGKTRLAAQKALPANAACVHLPDRTADPAIAHASGHGQAKPAGCVAALAARKFRRARFSALLRIASALDEAVAGRAGCSAACKSSASPWGALAWMDAARGRQLR